MNGTPWTKAEVSYLKRSVASKSHAEIGKELGRSRVSVQSYAHRHGLTCREFWTADDVAKLSSLYRHSTAGEVAKILSRSVKSVYNAVKLYGLTKQKMVTVDGRFLASLRRLNTSGYPDAEIARELGCERHTISKHRKSLGLPENAHSERRRETVAEKTKAQCRAAGVASLAGVRVRAFRDFASSRGWPSDLPPRAVMILDALNANGPMTREQLASAIGMTWRGSRNSLKSNGQGGTYLAKLVAGGLVINLGKLIKGRGKGHSICVYTLAPTAGPERENLRR